MVTLTYMQKIFCEISWKKTTDLYGFFSDVFISECRIFKNLNFGLKIPAIMKVLSLQKRLLKQYFSLFILFQVFLLENLFFVSYNNLDVKENQKKYDCENMAIFDKGFFTFQTIYNNISFLQYNLFFIFYLDFPNFELSYDFSALYG